MKLTPTIWARIGLLACLALFATSCNSRSDDARNATTESAEGTGMGDTTRLEIDTTPGDSGTLDNRMPADTLQPGATMPPPARQ